MLSTTYLDIPLGVLPNCLVAWDGVEERFHKKNLKYGNDNIFSRRGKLS